MNNSKRIIWADVINVAKLNNSLTKKRTFNQWEKVSNIPDILTTYNLKLKNKLTIESIHFIILYNNFHCSKNKYPRNVF